MNLRERKRRTHVVPERHDQNHGTLQSLAHLRKTTLVVEVVGIAEGGLLSRAVLRVDLVAAGAFDGGVGVGNNHAVLHVVSLDGREGAVVALDELGNNGELLGRVDGHARAVEIRNTLAVGVEVASIGIAVTGVAGIRVSATAVIACARVLADSGARVWGEGG